MDFVSRLKQFIDYRQVPITQFADNCRIPRPTLSQLLNGRNKKVSDEVIGKIHEAYPELSVMWLMFGEGNMVNDANMRISEPQKASQSAPSLGKPIRTERIMTQLDFEDDFNAAESENFSPIAPQEVQAENVVSFTERATADSVADVRQDSEANTAAVDPRRRSVVNIIVYYSDGTYENFVPGSARKVSK